ncbi:MAG: hypothetical protein FWB74_00460, partial [Defluviitaleaceae bacterium]|nr:hypothetical protein [Defluviitaleaceae bacterium]
NPEKPASRVKYHCYETDAEFVYCVEGAEGKIYKALEADMYWTKTDDGKFVKIYPTNTGFEDAWYLDASYKQVISDNFSRYGQSFIAQNFNWERVLKFIAEKFLDSGIKWYLTGSVTRAVSDADVKPKDIDIIVHTDDFYKVKELFKEYTIEPFVDNKGSWVIRYFGKLLIRGACVDIAADEKMDAKISQSAYEKVDWNGHEIFVIEI